MTFTGFRGIRTALRAAQLPAFLMEVSMQELTAMWHPYMCAGLPSPTEVHGRAKAAARAAASDLAEQVRRMVALRMA